MYATGGEHLHCDEVEYYVTKRNGRDLKLGCLDDVQNHSFGSTAKKTANIS